MDLLVERADVEHRLCRCDTGRFITNNIIAGGAGCVDHCAGGYTFPVSLDRLMPVTSYRAWKPGTGNQFASKSRNSSEEAISNPQTPPNYFLFP